jgi:hypothetical protein
MKFFDIFKRGKKPELTPKHEFGVLQSGRLETIIQMKELYKFLEQKYAYEYSLEEELDQCPGGPEFYINRYTNLKSQRQIEITLRRNSSAMDFFLKRLNKNTPPSYNDKENCFSFLEIDFYIGNDNPSRHHSYNPPDYALGEVKVGLEILNYILPVLKGEDWLDRKKLDNLYFQKKGFIPGDSESWVYSIIKDNFKYLLTDYNFKLVYDSDSLRPFEKGFGGAIIYGNQEKDLAIGFGIDLRDRNASLYQFKFTGYDLYSFGETGKNIWEGGIEKTDIIEAKKALDYSKILM